MSHRCLTAVKKDLRQIFISNELVGACKIVLLALRTVDLPCKGIEEMAAETMELGKKVAGTYMFICILY